MKNVKPIDSLNHAEKALICGVKSRIFMEYTPIGNIIAFKFAEQAHHFQSEQPEWMITRLITKGRIIRNNQIHQIRQMPEKDEMDVAKILSASKTNPAHLLQAAGIFINAALVYKLNDNYYKSNKLYWTSSELIL